MERSHITKLWGEKVKGEGKGVMLHIDDSDFLNKFRYGGRVLVENGHFLVTKYANDLMKRC